MEHGPGTVLVRYGEIGTKSSKVRSDMERLLRENLESMLAARDVEAAIDHEWSRILLRTDDADNTDAAVAAACDTFGVVSASPARSVDPTREAICEALVAAAADHPDGATFGVRATRAGSSERHPFSSRDLEIDGGSAVEAETGATVDLDDPDRTYYVECRAQEAFVFTEKRPGPGGLPLGTQGRAVVLLSGGLDSPVAAWEMMKRGCRIVPVYVDLGPYGGVDHQARALSTVGELTCYAPDDDLSLRIVPAGPLVETLMAEVGSTRMLSLRRVMLRIGEAVARDVGAHSVVTGESLGQKSSQTGGNLAATDAATSLPVHRPLLTRDKTDIVDQARAIGTFDDSTITVGCEQVAPSHPETNATPAEVAAAEPDDLFDRVETLLDRVEVVTPEETRS
ncbi:tRNA sulfurtransferase [Halogranum rubrum]|uniref:Probable tRNA sulfurtransferase n=1 Tax=Halogranum salarium B-1 TaxID=1210908 RepID=J3A6H2_9EURY|nr:tRNA sulfurtransferase [Halogranum salarium]EJN61093.1 hypothetical protein HSB1_01340 [Halogranum salarium B-1]